MSLRACRNCRSITERSTCPVCRSTDLSEDFSGLIIILDPKNSQLAKKLKIDKEGRYALKVR